MAFERISPPLVTSAAHVSSQLVSTPRITAGFTGGRIVQAPAAARLARRGRPPHDHRVLAVVVVVAPPAARGLEPEALVEPDGRGVGGPHLQRVLLAVGIRDLEQALDQGAGDPLAPAPVVDRHVHQVPDRVVARADEVAEHAPAVDGREADAGRLGQLEHEHRQRPRGRESASLDRDHLGQVRVGRRLISRGCELTIGALRREVVGNRVKAPRAPRPARPLRAGKRGARGSRAPPTRLAPRGHRPPRRRLEIVPSRPPHQGGSGPPSGRARQPRSAARPGRPELLAVPVQSGEDLPALCVEVGRRSSELDAGRERRERRDRPQLRPARVSERPRGGHPDPQPVNVPGPVPRRSHRHPASPGRRAPALPRAPASARARAPAGRRARSAGGRTSKASPSARSRHADVTAVEVSKPSRFTRPSPAGDRRRGARAGPAPPAVRPGAGRPRAIPRTRPAPA